MTPHHIHVMTGDCWTAMIKSNSFSKMYVYAQCSVQFYRVQYVITVLILWCR